MNIKDEKIISNIASQNVINLTNSIGKISDINYNGKLEKALGDFWSKDVWNSNIKYIYNKKIKDVIGQIQKLYSMMKKSEVFFVVEDNDFLIKSSGKILNQIEKIKSDNIKYIKSHGDSIPEYHKIIIKYKKNILFIN
jgi:hypothetical protein